MSNKKTYRVAGEYRVNFCVTVDADSEEEAEQMVLEDPVSVLGSTVSEDIEIDDVAEVDEASQ